MTTSTDVGGQQNLDMTASPPFELRLVARKGLGLFATQPIRRGACIIEEPSLVSLPRKPGTSTLDGSPLLDKLESLDSDQHGTYFTLGHQPQFAKRSNVEAVKQRLISQGKKPSKRLDLAAKEEVEAHAIFKTNSVPMGKHNKHGGGVFPLLSRINHDCLPNTQYHYNATLARMTVRAVCDIKPDEEITTAYFDCGFLPTEQRAEALRGTWGFDCCCGTCLHTNPGLLLQSEDRREAMFELMGSLLVFDKGEQTSPLLAAKLPRDAANGAKRAEKLIKLTIEEGLCNLHLANAYVFSACLFYRPRSADHLY